MSNKQKRKLTWAIILLLFIGIGFAYLNSSLSINGTTEIAGNTWDVHFETVVPSSNNTATVNVAPVANPNDKVTDLSYEIMFNKPGDIYEFSVNVRNAGSIDAMIEEFTSKIKIGDGQEQVVSPSTLPSYLDYSVTYDDGGNITENHLLEADSSETIKVHIEYKMNISNAELEASAGKTIIFTLGLDYTQRDENAISRVSPIVLPNGKTKDNLSVGDLITIHGTTDEEFYFVRYDGNDIVMMAKHNLNVGNNPDGEETFIQKTNDTGYTGSVAFSATNYWDDNGSPSSSYSGAYYPALTGFPYVFDNDYDTEPDFEEDGYQTEDYSVAYYVKRYKSILSGAGYGATIKDARLLTMEEALDNSIGCELGNWTCPRYVDDPEYTNDPAAFITTNSYWFGSADSSDQIWVTDRSGDIYSYSYASSNNYGVRPVIVIAKANV